jgi:hypothetical protein
MSTQAYKDAVELAVDRWNAHDERYFEAYTEDASMHGFPANVPPTVEGIRALFGGCGPRSRTSVSRSST